MTVDKDSYLSHPALVDNKILFNQGQLIPAPGNYCGNGGPVKVAINHVYQIHQGRVSSLIPNHLDKTVSENLEQLDSTSILFNNIYFKLNDSCGVFLPKSVKNEYWIYRNDRPELVQLGGDTTITAHYPRWFKEKLLVYIRTKDHSSQLFYFDARDLTLHPFIKEEYTFRVHNPIVYDSLIVFNTYDKATKDHQLYIADYEGRLHRVTYFPRGLYHFRPEIKIDSLLYIKMLNKGIPDNYSQKYFRSASFWKLNLHTKKLEQISEYDDHSLSYKNEEVTRDICQDQGYEECWLYKVGNEGNVLPLPVDTTEMESCCRRSIQLGADVLLIGKAATYQDKFIVVDQATEQVSFSEALDRVSRVAQADSLLVYMSTKGPGDVNLYAYFNNEVLDLSGVRNLGKVNRFSLFEYQQEYYLITRQRDRSQCYRVDLTAQRAYFLLDNIMNVTDTQLQMREEKDAYYFKTDHGLYFMLSKWMTPNERMIEFYVLD
jgi:hypothetical protein